MKKIKWHIIGVLLYSIYVLLLDYLYYPKFYIAPELTMLVAEIWIFYSGYSILYFLFIAQRKYKFLFILALFISLIGSYFAILSNHFANFYTFNKAFTQKKVIYDTTQVYTHFFIYALGYFFAQRSIQKQKQLRLAEKQHAEAEKAKLEIENKNLRLQEDKTQLQNDNLLLQNEKIKLEYNFLKAQINPHFLYNTLNFFYSKTLMHSEEAADGIAKLTDIMRYALQTGGADGKVFLEQEVEHIHNYIALQRMRFNNTICIDFTATGNIHSYRILPHILITLLENAFKHGDTLDPQHPVTVRLQAVENCIYFSIYNKIRIGPKDGPSTGVGLSNISDRLQMEYGNKQSLQYNSDGSFFSVQLSIQSNGTGISTAIAATPIDATN